MKSIKWMWEWNSASGRQSQCARGELTRGFTLLELLVTIGIIGILAALLLPAVSAVKKRGKAVGCLNNLKQVQIAWQLYADDNKGIFPINTSGRDAGLRLDQPSWVAGYLSTRASPDNTNKDLLIGDKYHRFGSLGQYTKNADIYHCPSDVSRDKGNDLVRVRSIAMNSWINPGRNGVVSGRYWDESYAKFTSVSDFASISPSDIFVFLDERPESINDGWFMVDMTSYDPSNVAGLKVRDLPAVYHNNASSFSFVDGHAEFHKWKDPRTAALPFKSRGQPTPGNRDILWLMEHATKPLELNANQTN